MTTQKLLATFLRDHPDDYLTFAECRAWVRSESGKELSEEIAEALSNLIALGRVEIVANDRSFGPGFQWRNYNDSAQHN